MLMLDLFESLPLILPVPEKQF